MSAVGESGLPSASFPGWTRLEADLEAAAAHGDDVKLSVVEVMVVLGERQRLRDQLAAAKLVTAEAMAALDEIQQLRDQMKSAIRLLRAVKAGNSCWGSQQGYVPCAIPGVDGFLAGEAKRRPWWKRRRT